ncbi:MAG TPA: FtsX-like permease family protein, partial [Gemmatimonadaceae bacterium]|nr:FtsX-like permease family protein [Gemmatimonadaceae bacterium]
EREFSRSAAALGQSVVVGAQRMTIIGVAPRAFRGLGLDDTDYWMPFNATVTDSTAGRPFDMPMDVRFQVLLRAAAPRRRAAVGAAVARALQGTNPMISAGSTVTLAPVTDALDPQNDKMTVSVVWRLAIASLIVFVIACSNVANLMLIRMSRRRREIAIRFALGVSRGRLALHLLTEAILLALAAGIPAALTAGWGYLGLTNALLPRVAWDIGDEAVRGAGVVLVLMCMGGLAIGLLPALYLRDPDLADGLRSNIDSAPRASRFRAVLLVAQTALSVVLLAGAGLFVRSLAAVEQVGFGYRAENVLLASVAYDAKWSPLTRDESARVNETAQRIRALPGIANVALAWPMPLKGVGTSRLRLPGRDSVPTIPGVQTWMSVVSPGFFNVMGVRVVRGREFTDDDRRGGTPVALVSAAMASLYWPGEEPIGKCILVGYRSPVCRIVVGVVADVHAFKIFETQSLHYYVPYAQESRELAMPRTLVVGIDSTAGPAVSTRLRRALGGDVGGGLRWEVTTLANVMEPEFRPWRLSATLVAVLGLIAIVVAGIGTYGTTAFAVSQRVHELSVRRILGATGRHIAALVMIGTLRLVAIGALIGMTVVLAAGPLAKSMLYGVSGHDPHSLGLAVLLQIIGGAAACVVPTLYAVRTEPTVALASSG